jgi:hypothetical protein
MKKMEENEEIEEARSKEASACRAGNLWRRRQRDINCDMQRGSSASNGGGSVIFRI